MFYCAICAGVSWGMVALKNVLCVGGVVVLVKEFI